MDRGLDYSSIIKSVLSEWKKLAGQSNIPDTELLLSFDNERQIYFLMRLGWGKEGRVRNVLFLLRILDGKVWIEENRTDQDIAIELIEAGIPRDHIVLGLQPPNMRPYTDYAAA